MLGGQEGARLIRGCQKRGKLPSSVPKSQEKLRLCVGLFYSIVTNDRVEEGARKIAFS